MESGQAPANAWTYLRFRNEVPCITGNACRRSWEREIVIAGGSNYNDRDRFQTSTSPLTINHVPSTHLSTLTTGAAFNAKHSVMPSGKLWTLQRPCAGITAAAWNLVCRDRRALRRKPARG